MLGKKNQVWGEKIGECGGKKARKEIRRRKIKISKFREIMKGL